MSGPYECYACGKRTKGTREFTLTVCLADDDGRRVPVGPDCHRKTRQAGGAGYQPPKGGPRLYFNESLRPKSDASPEYAFVVKTTGAIHRTAHAPLVMDSWEERECEIKPRSHAA